MSSRYQIFFERSLGRSWRLGERERPLNTRVLDLDLGSVFAFVTVPNSETCESTHTRSYYLGNTRMNSVPYRNDFLVTLWSCPKGVEPFICSMILNPASWFDTADRQETIWVFRIDFEAFRFDLETFGVDLETFGVNLIHEAETVAFWARHSDLTHFFSFVCRLFLGSIFFGK